MYKILLDTSVIHRNICRQNLAPNTVHETSLAATVSVITSFILVKRSSSQRRVRFKEGLIKDEREKEKERERFKRRNALRERKFHFKITLCTNGLESANQ